MAFVSFVNDFVNYIFLAEEARILGLVMIPGRHIVSIHVDNSYETM